jgi:hypothetical protein
MTFGLVLAIDELADDCDCSRRRQPHPEPSRRAGSDMTLSRRAGVLPPRAGRRRTTLARFVQGGSIVNDVGFDAVVRGIAQSSSRRRLLRGAAAGALGAATLGLADVAAKGKKGGKGKNGFRLHGDGAITSPGAPGCQEDEAGCDVTMEGDANATHLGKASFSGTLTVIWANGTPNPDGGGGVCAPASGETVLTVGGATAGKKKGKKQGTLTLALDGTDCEVGGSGAAVPHQFTGTYAITGGTGDFEGATGEGALEALNTGGDLSVKAKGKIHL